jgi:hypothetical protein
MTQKEYAKYKPILGGNLHIQGQFRKSSESLKKTDDLQELVQDANDKIGKPDDLSSYVITVISKGFEKPILQRRFGETKWSKWG